MMRNRVPTKTRKFKLLFNIYLTGFKSSHYLIAAFVVHCTLLNIYTAFSCKLLPFLKLCLVFTEFKLYVLAVISFYKRGYKKSKAILFSSN